MTESVPGQTPEPAAADAASATPPAAGDHAAGRPDQTPEPGAATTEPPSADPIQTAEPGRATEPGQATAAADPQELFGSLSLAAIEADIDRLMNDKMSQLDGMLAGLEDLVQRLEGEITNLEPPPDDTTTP